MKAGRKPKPSHLKVLNGSAKQHPDRVNHAEPVAPSDAPSCPSHLTDMGKQTFLRKCDQLRRLGILSSVDVDVIERYAATYARWREELQVESTPAQCRLLMQLEARLDRMDSEMGLTPSSRSRVAAPKKETTGTDDDLRKKHGFGA